MTTFAHIKKLHDDKINEIYKYEDKYIIFLIEYFLCSNTETTLPNLIEFLGNNIDLKYISNSSVKKYIEKNCIKVKAKYYLNEEYIKLMEITLLFKKNILSNNNYEKLISDFNSAYFNEEHNTKSQMLSILNIQKYNHNYDDIYYLSLIYYLLKNYDFYYYEIENKFKNVNKLFYSYNINDFLSNKTLVELLILNNINNIESLLNIPIPDIINLFSLDIDNFVSSLDSLNLDNTILSLKNKDKLYFGLNENEIHVLKKRTDYCTKEKIMTLEEISNELGVTRERIRQIEAKAIKKIKEESSNYNIIIICLFRKLKRKNKHYLSLSVLNNYIKDEDVSNMIINYINCERTNIRFSIKLKCIYDSSIISEDEIINQEIKKIGNMVRIKDVNTSDLLSNSIIRDNYKVYNEFLYFLKGFSYSEAIVELIGENFPSGFKPSDEQEYNKLKQIINEKWPELINTEFPNPHTLNAMMERKNMILVDRGRYNKIENCPSISQELKDNILFFILSNAPMVYYKSIFNKFSTELKNLGIDNYYLMKGLLDIEMPSEFHPRRDYITVGDKDLTAVGAVVDFMKTFKDDFSIDDLKRKFPGVEEYVFNSYIYTELDKGLLNISPKRYIYFENLNINDVQKSKLKDIIENIFIQLNEDTITINKLYSKILINEKELYQSLHINLGSTFLFSLIKYIFDDEYYFSRPYISKSATSSFDNYEFIKNHTLSFDEFEKKDIDNYILKMNFRVLYSYLNFMEDMSDKYVQIDIDKMVKKELLLISSGDLIKIENSLNLLLNTFKEINTSNFNAYQLFPELKYEWNKYLLIGIIRSYFKDKFIIDNTENKYNSTEFIVRSVNNE